LPEIRADKGTPFISHASDGEEEETEKEGEDALFVEEGEQEEEAGEGLILSELSQRVAEVQKKGRNVERQKKRKADEMEAKAAGSGNIRSGTAIASGSGAPGAPTVRSTRAAIARGEASLARGRGGARGAYGRGKTS
jgi:hypothetical protein